MCPCQNLCAQHDLFYTAMAKWSSFHSVLVECLNSDDSVAWLLIFTAHERKDLSINATITAALVIFSLFFM